MNINPTDIESINEEIKVYHIPDKVTIMSAYELSEDELTSVRKMFPALKEAEIVNLVDKNIFSGLIIKIGTRIVDLTLNGALQNLKKQIYESN